MSDPTSRNYLAKRINPILEKLVIDLVIKRPENITKFMIEWLSEKGEKIEKSTVDGGAQAEDTPSDSDEEGQEELMDIKKLQQLKADKAMRTSVSAEAYGRFNQKAAFKPKKIFKNPQQLNRIKQRMAQAFMFSALDPQEQTIVIEAMEELNVSAGTKVIVQGDDGDCMYLIDSGQLDCYRRATRDGEDKKVKTYQPGEAFGELALLYNAPRAATIIAVTDATLFKLDRETFNHIVKDSAAKKRERYEQFLQKVDILQDMEPYERLQVADALKSQKFKKGDVIVKEGDVGDTFYILEEGEVIATKVLKAGQAPEQVYTYKPGEYFGELALLKNAARAASIVATADCTVVSLDRNSFKRLLGPLEEILRRNFQKYEKYLA